MAPRDPLSRGGGETIEARFLDVVFDRKEHSGARMSVRDAVRVFLADLGSLRKDDRCRHFSSYL